MLVLGPCPVFCTNNSRPISGFGSPKTIRSLVAPSTLARETKKGDKQNEGAFRFSRLLAFRLSEAPQSLASNFIHSHSGKWRIGRSEALWRPENLLLNPEKWTGTVFLSDCEFWYVVLMSNTQV